jgi:hypothetical protein
VKVKEDRQQQINKWRKILKNSLGSAMKYDFPLMFLQLIEMFNPFKPKLVVVMFKNSVRTSKKKRISMTAISWLMLFREITSVSLRII